MTGYRTLAVMLVWFLLVLWDQNVRPIPYVPHELLEITGPVLGLLMRFLTTTPIGASDESSESDR